MKKVLLPVILVQLILFSCNQSGGKLKSTYLQESNEKEIISIVNELHQLECSYLNNAGIKSDSFNTYDFRAAAFQEILKDRNRKILVDYETKYQKLASLEFELTKDQKTEYEKTVDEIYTQPCR